MEKFKLLFLSVEIGAGHTRTAQAISKVLPEVIPNSEVRIVDFFNYMNPIMRKALVDGYIEIIKTTPAIYRYLYNRAEERESLLEFNKLLDLASKVKLKKLFAEFNPDIIVSTHAFPSGVLSVLKEKRKITKPIVTIITDYTAHPFWIYHNMDKYIVATEEIANILKMKGINQTKIHTTGIPIDPIFKNVPSKTEARINLGLDRELFTVLISGGGLGLGPLETIVNNLAATDLPIQIVVMVGKNEILEQRIKRARCGAKVPINVIGYTNNVHQLMASADLLISKPGGLTCAEALSIGLPIIVSSPIPGQEERNSKFIVDSGVGMKLEKPEEAGHLISRLMEDKNTLMRMREKALSLGKPDAAYSACQILKQVYLS
ncbi:MAG TPA: glycosyltransferase [Clostridia bacterium]|jgi:processive 1,2-diacylglycerol beta-glucosyltransferase|nr:glycosyltransferase [Clostridia bacterium]